MRTLMFAAALIAGSATLADAQTLGKAAGANGGGAAAIDPMPGSTVPTPSIVGDPSNDAQTVRISAGARVRVARDTRCSDGARSWGPVSGPDTHYYCEASGPAAAAGLTATGN